MNQVVLVGAAHYVPELELGPVISNVLRMVEVMMFRRSAKRNQSVGTPGKLVSAMTIQSFTYSYNQPKQDSRQMHPAAQQLGPHHCWKEVGEDVFRPLRIDGSVGNRVVKLMVGFVNQRVQLWVMSQSM